MPVANGIFHDFDLNGNFSKVGGKAMRSLQDFSIHDFLRVLGRTSRKSLQVFSFIQG